MVHSALKLEFRRKLSRNSLIEEWVQFLPQTDEVYDIATKI